jgi:hypothetical protein
MYVKINNQTVEKYPYSIGNLRKDNPQTSFPKNPSNDTLAEWNVFPVVSTSASYDSATQIATQQGCVYNEQLQRWETDWIIRDKTAEELAEDLSVAKNKKREEIKQAFATEELQPVESLTIQWNGGYDSALKMDGAKRMAEMMTLNSVEFYDVNNIGHDLSIPDAETVITGVGVVYQVLFQKKQSLYQQIDSVTTVGELDGIYW